MAKFQKNRRIGNRLTRKLLVILLLVMILCAAAVAGTSARYVQRSERLGVVKAKEFYFTSDYLTPGGASYTLNPGTTEITFELRNYDGLKLSELPIKYTVKQGDNTIKEGEIGVDEEQSVPITLSGLTPGVYQVTATGENGYSRILSATFTVREGTEGIYKHTENYGDYVILSIWTQGVEKTATFTVPAGLIPDYTDPNLRESSAGSGILATLKPNESISYRFFKDSGYAAGEIAVTADGKEVKETPLS